MISKINYSILSLVLFCLVLTGCKEDENTVYLSLNATYQAISVAESFQFIAKVQDTELDYNEQVTWSLVEMVDSNGKVSSIATINQEGIVTGVALGTGKVKAALPNGQYVLAYIIIGERKVPINGLEFAKSEMYLSIDAVVPDTLELFVDPKLVQKYELKVSSDNEQIFEPTIHPGKDENSYKIILKCGKEEGTATLKASLGEGYSISAKVHVGVKLYLSFESINTALGTPSLVALSSFTFNVGTTGTIPVHFSASPDDQIHLNDLDFYVSVAGKSIFKTVSQRIEGKIVYVDVIVGKEKGDATITVEALGNKVVAECTVMDKNDVEVAEIGFVKDYKLIETTLRSLALYEKVKIKPLAAAALWPPVWSSSDESVAIVNEEGVVSFKKRGVVQIKAMSKDKWDICTITAQLRATDLIFNSNLKNDLFPGETTQWSARVSTNFDDNAGLLWQWKSADPTIATVNENGVITAIASGKVKIQVAVTDDLNKTITIEKEVTVQNSSSIKIYDLNFDSKSFNYMENSENTGIDVFDPELPEADPHYYSFILTNMKGEVLTLQKGKTYRIGTDLSARSFVQFWEFDGEKALFESGTLEMTNSGTVIFNIGAKEGSKGITIKGSVDPNEI